MKKLNIESATYEIDNFPMFYLEVEINRDENEANYFIYHKEYRVKSYIFSEDISSVYLDYLAETVKNRLPINISDYIKDYMCN